MGFPGISAPFPYKPNNGRRFFSESREQRRIQRIHQRSRETEVPDNFFGEIILQRRLGLECSLHAPLPAQKQIHCRMVFRENPLGPG